MSQEICEISMVIADLVARVDKLRENWFRRHPITEREVKMMITVIRDGGFLCCDEGQKNLEKIFPESRTLWVGKINNWAYETLGCDKSGGTSPGFYPGFYATPEGRAKSIAKIRAKWGEKS